MKEYIEGPAQLTGFEHYMVKNAECKATDYFGVKKVPYCVLVDNRGKIAFIGHPSWRRLDEDIATLLEGKKLSGRGTIPLAEQRKNEWQASGGSINPAEVNIVIKQFMT